MIDNVETAKRNIRARLADDDKRLPGLIAAWQAEKLPLTRAERRAELRRLCVGNQQDRKKLKRWEAMG